MDRATERRAGPVRYRTGVVGFVLLVVVGFVLLVVVGFVLLVVVVAGLVRLLR